MKSLETTEGNALAALQADLPAVLATVNAAVTDGWTVPTVATWQRGLYVQVQEYTADRFPLVSVGCYGDQPIGDGFDSEVSLEAWGTKVRRPVVLLAMATGATAAQAHTVRLRLVDALTRVCRSAARIGDGLGGAVDTWPYALQVEIEPPVPLPRTTATWLAIASIEAETAQVWGSS